ncbi:MAG: thiol peroxidase [Spirochaeta sp.]|jgi:thiol peroxidase|nr:thiol peroxidase [Spirochaeta sp.]
MAKITFKGNPINTSGDLPAVGSNAPDFVLTTDSLEDVGLARYKGKKKILNIVPSLDTGVCAARARRVDKDVASHDDVVCLTVSDDLPFASSRFCKAEGVSNVITLSELRDREFGSAYGVRIVDGPLAGLLSRAVVVLDENNTVVYTEQVPEIAQEPDYDAALKAVS